MRVYELVSENLINVGGPMGTESTSANWRHLFETLSSAKHFALEDYLRQRDQGDEDLKWEKESGPNWNTQDLRFVMYHITAVKVRR